MLFELFLEKFLAEIVHHIGVQAGCFVDAEEIYPSIWQETHTGESIQ